MGNTLKVRFPKGTERSVTDEKIKKKCSLLAP
jgi:hypothetical protein